MSDKFLGPAGVSELREILSEELSGKQDALTGEPGQIVGFDDEGKPQAQDVPKGSSGYVHTFTAGDWVTADSDDGLTVTITIPAATHGLAGKIVSCQAFLLENGTYRGAFWGAYSTYATMEAGGDITLRLPNSKGYAGAVVLQAYQTAIG